jgi:enterochelin esterase-like enzyme
MNTSRTHRAHLGRSWVSSVVLVAVVLAAASAAAVRPAAAADEWVSVPQEEYYRFTVPNSAALAATGGVQPIQVAVEGNFGPGWVTTQFNTSRSGANWTSTVGPMEPGLYIYRYRAILPDRSSVFFHNPASPPEVTSDADTYTLFVPGDSTGWLADVADGGAVDTLPYDSEGEQRMASVWTPAGYNADRAEPYPVLYLQHGEGGDALDWVQLGRAPQILDNLAAAGDLEPMVVVMGDGNVDDLTTSLLDELSPAVQASYNVSSQPDHQAIAGIGQGADQALEVVADVPGVFTSVGVFSSLNGLPAGVDAGAINDGTDLLRVYVGNTNDPAYNPTYELLQDLDQAGIDHQFDGVNPGSGAAWKTWQESLHDLAPRLFRSVGDTGRSDGHRALTEPYQPPAPGTTPTPWIDEHGMVTFETTTEFADATDVTIWANFGAGGSWPRVPMERDGDRWRVTVGPVDPWFYYYRIMVDGTGHKDTSNPESMTTETTWSPFLVPGEPARMVSDVPEGESGNVEPLTFASSAVGGQRTAYVWTPPGYDADRSVPYPVFFLQHGGGQSYTDWLEVGRARQILDNHHRDGNLADMVVVMGNGNGVNFPNELRNFLRPAVQEAYNVSHRPEHQALAGLSMGAGHTFSTIMAHAEEFGYAGMFSGFGSVPGSADADVINEALRLFYVSTGDITDFTFNATMNLRNSLLNAGIDHEFRIGIGPHGWDTWQRDLIDFAPRLFTPQTKDDCRKGGWQEFTAGHGFGDQGQCVSYIATRS